MEIDSIYFNNWENNLCVTFNLYTLAFIHPSAVTYACLHLLMCDLFMVSD